MTGNKWIPVTERFPEDESYVLCWYEYWRYGEYDGLYQTYGIGFYWNGSWGGEVSCGNRCRVIAWMPLPEPYKESK